MTSARVVAITKSLVLEASTGGEFVAFAARVSNPGNQANTATAPKLLDYLKRHKHWSPFEMASATVEIQTTRDISHQIVRHRSFSFQEFSQRYAEVDAGVAYRQCRMQHPTNRQASIDCDEPDIEFWWAIQYDAHYNRSKRLYDEALELGIAKEVARAVLPEGLTPTTLYMAGTFRSWIHWLDVREEEGTQREHRDVAKAIRVALAEHEPLIFGEAA